MKGRLQRGGERRLFVGNHNAFYIRQLITLKASDFRPQASGTAKTARASHGPGFFSSSSAAPEV
jgi:hypothetical protein